LPITCLRRGHPPVAPRHIIAAPRRLGLSCRRGGAQAFRTGRRG
jgi:hypothetical protein